MPAGAIALVQRGTCTFAKKFKLANRSGAGGMILFNEGQPGRTVPLWFDVTGIDVPSMAATYDAAEELANGVEHGPTGLTAPLQDRLAARDLPDAQRDRGDRSSAIRTT